MEAVGSWQWRMHTGQRAEVVVEWLRCEATKSYGSRVGGEHGGDKS